MAKTNGEKNFFIKSRKQRIDQLLQDIKKNPRKPVSEILTEFCMRNGTTEKTTQGYLAVLVSAEKVKVETREGKDFAIASEDRR